jgi:chromate reductase, NAD(P)H dehydrogenase (quinone)
MNKLDIIGLCGSLRAASMNHHALRLAGEVMPEGMQLSVADWREIPIFDADHLAREMPSSVASLRAQISRADGVLIATPEYNFSIPGGLKNAIDWLSRSDDQPFNGKPVAILSASPGPLGGARVQYDLRKVMLFLNAMPLVKPEVFIGSAAAKFDATTGRCTDEITRKFVADQMSAFSRWIGGVARMNAPQ